MARRIDDRTYRSTAELIRAIRDKHLLTQDELAGRAGLSRYQLCRWEKGTREPTLEAVRRLLSSFGLAVTFGSSLGPLEPEEVTVGSELVVVALVGTIRVLLVEELPVARVITVVRQFVGERTPIDVPVVPLVALQEPGILGSAAAALARRLLQRAIGSEM